MPTSIDDPHFDASNVGGIQLAEVNAALTIDCYYDMRNAMSMKWNAGKQIQAENAAVSNTEAVG